MKVKVKKENTRLTPFDKSTVNPLAAECSFCYPSLGMVIILYIPSIGTDFFIIVTALYRLFFGTCVLRWAILVI